MRTREGRRLNENKCGALPGEVGRSITCAGSPSGRPG